MSRTTTPAVELIAAGKEGLPGAVDTEQHPGSLAKFGG